MLQRDLCTVLRTVRRESHAVHGLGVVGEAGEVRHSRAAILQLVHLQQQTALRQVHASVTMRPERKGKGSRKGRKRGVHLPELLSATSAHRPLVSTYPRDAESEGCSA